MRTCSGLFLLLCSVFLSSPGMSATIQPTLTLSAPNGGKSLIFGRQYEVSWNSMGISGNVKLLLLKDRTTVGTIAQDLPCRGGGLRSATGKGTYEWTVGMFERGHLTEGRGLKVRVQTMDGRYMDDSDSSFTIGNPESKLTITAPGRSQAWKHGTTQDIVWKYENVRGKGDIELHSGGRLVGHIAKNIAVGSVGRALMHAGTLRHRWTVGDYIGLDKRAGHVVSGTYKIKIIVPSTGKYAEITIRILDTDPLSFTPGESRPVHTVGDCDYSIESVRFLRSVTSRAEIEDVIRYSENRAKFTVVASIHWNGRLPSGGGVCGNRLEISLNGRVHERRAMGDADAEGNIVITRTFNLVADEFAPALRVGLRIYPSSSQCDSNPGNNQRHFRFEMVEVLVPRRF